MVINAIVSSLAIAALTFIEWCLLQHGLDGTITLIVVGAISGIAGYNINKILAIVKDKDK